MSAVAIWRVAKEWAFEAHIEGSDTSGGYGYLLRQNETGETRELSVLTAGRPSEATYEHVRAVVRKYLDHPNPPPRVRLDHQGQESPTPTDLRA